MKIGTDFREVTWTRVGIPSEAATWCASSVLPVPGSPRRSRGRSSARATLTAFRSGSLAM